MHTITHRAHLSLWSPVHARVELAGHNGHAPEVLGDRNVRGSESEPGLPKVAPAGLGSGRESVLSCRALILPSLPRAQALAQMAAGHEGDFQWTKWLKVS